MQDSINITTSNLELNHFYSRENEGVRLHYVRKGKGAPVILLHGWPGFWYDWRKVIPALSEKFDVIAPDFRGFGNSDKPDLLPHEGYTPEHLASDIFSLIQELELQNVIMVAHDIGATVAQTIVRNYPKSVKGLVLLNPPYPGIGSRRFDPTIQKEFWYQYFHNLPLAEKLISNSKENIKIYLTHFYEHWIGKKARITPEELDTITEVYSRERHFAASIAYYKARAAAKTSKAVNTPTLPPISHETKVLWGEDDPVIPVNWSDKLDEHFSNVSLEILPGVGHFVPFEDPKAVIKKIEEFQND
ncbi:alpha/beta fold hydrolase [Neobacillus niacini]|uniref:alpha/beta fold hydrolase n=1 Tax=Neobacillus niacini TaxID=86668 RepID=UPI0021CB755A|nr:alpha/beta hydrolase [Neobacillus niacini]MCM3766338.1 alpha/beta hydrolase [Neobacillus niacini]